MTAPADLYEKLSVFYLGAKYDLKTQQSDSSLVLYDSQDLVTHAVVVGMTGSGKTGLGISLLEEAGIDGIPAIVIDPKGDLTNLALRFPNMSAADLAPWIAEEDAQRQGQSREQFAQTQADRWRQGLAESGQSLDRIAKFQQSADVRIYTPGSDAGLPLSILSSFAPPPPAIADDAELVRDRINTTVTGLLSLLGITGNPMQSREHILLTTLLDHSWRERQPLDLGTLIRLVQQPPMSKIGVLDLESFFPAQDRFALAMTLNNLLASPSFSTWMTGEPLDIDHLLYSGTSKPRLAIIYLAHLPDAERMFFMSLILNEVLGWMRSRPGTSSLRALLYIDEIFGYFPPVAEPPTKRPLMTLLKQARAYGLGVVLATQNPVDLDYKGLSNMGTWFLGRLQTDRDKQRMLDGLEGASAQSGSTFDRAAMSEAISGLGKRVFLMHNVHESEPVIFRTRSTLSYLAGPLTRPQLKQLMAPFRTDATSTAADMAVGGAEAIADGLATRRATGGPPVELADALPSTGQPSHVVSASAMAQQPPVLAPGISQWYLPILQRPGDGQIDYRPRLLAMARVHFQERSSTVATDQTVTLLTPFNETAGPIDWQQAEVLRSDGSEPIEPCAEPPAPGRFQEVPAPASVAKHYGDWKKSFADHLYHTQRYSLWRCPELDEVSHANESERDFRIRLADRLREMRDQQLQSLRAKYAEKENAIEERIRKAQARVDRERDQARNAGLQTAINIGTTILSALLGRKKLNVTTLGKAGTAARSAGRAAEQSQDVARAQQDVEAFQEKIAALGNQLSEEVAAIERQLNADSLPLESVILKPRKTDIDVRLVTLAWAPYLAASSPTAADTQLYR